MIAIPILHLKAARKLLTRLRFERLKLPVLNHVLATLSPAGLTLAVTDLDHWLETRLPSSIHSDEARHFLIPAQALAAAVKGDKGSTARFECGDNPEKPSLRLTVTCGGMQVETIYHPEPAKDFPQRPSIQGRITAVPKETLMALGKIAGCASTDSTRYLLNGVLFSPEDGGRLIATDGRRLAGAPARVPARAFVLPNAAVHVLGHSDFSTRDAAILQDENVSCEHMQFRSGPHTLIAKRIDGSYPNYRQVIPPPIHESVTIPEDRRPALIAWLRSLGADVNSVRLSFEIPGHLTLTHRNREQVAGTLQVPVTTQGQSPVMCFDPKYLAEALDFGATLHLGGHLHLGMVGEPSGEFCLLMSRRDSVEPVIHPTNATQTAAIAA
jgi:DNA polymerase-3 subunit beta